MDKQLPTRWAFVLRLSGDAKPADGIYRGRIEHINSGRTAQFTSMVNVADFVRAIVADERLNDEHGRE
jgi:hypothetical protein